MHHSIGGIAQIEIMLLLLGIKHLPNLPHNQRGVESSHQLLDQHHILWRQVHHVLVGDLERHLIPPHLLIPRQVSLIAGLRQQCVGADTAQREALPSFGVI